MANPKVSKAAIRRRLMKKKKHGAADQGHADKRDTVKGNKKGYPGLRSS